MNIVDALRATQSSSEIRHQLVFPFKIQDLTPIRSNAAS
jgi:hypothetical protein